MNQYTMKVKIFLVCFLTVVAILLLVSRTATPLSPSLFQIKRFQEKVFMKLKATPKDKLQYYTFLLNERLKDLISVSEANDSSFILTTSLRYSTTAGQLTELIKDNNLTNEIPDILKLFGAHQRIIAELVDSYPQNLDNEWKYIQDDVNYLEIYSQALRDIK